MNRFINASDFNAVHNLYVQVHQLHVENLPDVYRNADPLSQEEFSALLHDPNTIAMVAEESPHGVVGFCQITIKPPSPLPMAQPRTVAHMDVLAVDPRCQNHGIGKALFLEARALAQSRGAQALQLKVWAFNASAIHFYESLGMAPSNYTLEQKL